MHLLRTSALLFALSVLAPLTAQGSWTFRSSASNPSAGIPAAAWDSVRQEIVIVIGDGETWSWTGTAWTRRFPTGNKPSNRISHAVGFDPGRGQLVLFGGEQGNASLNDIWEWDGTTWTGFTPGPARRLGHRMVFDPVRQRVMMFGGVGLCNCGGGWQISNLYAETWEWLGGAWIQLSPVTSPAPRFDFGMTWDSASNRAVVFGGTDGSLLMGDTWEWDGSNWTQRFPANSPSPRRGAAVVYDPTAARTYLFGGKDGNGPLADMWSWDGQDWTLLALSSRPAARFDHAMVFDPVRNEVVLFGGSNGGYLRDTWTYTPGIQGTYSFFGSGCAGSRGTPSLSVQNNQVPIAGQPFSVQFDNLPLTGQAWMFLGASKTNYGGLPLPADLSIIGMFGCSLYVSGDLIFPVQNILGVGLWTITVPPVLLGLPIYNQAIVFDPPANGLGLTVSDAGEGVVGG